MRIAAPAVCILFVFLVSCGYVGPVVPPSPQIPAAVVDLVVTELGDQLQISFTTPARTTDNLAISKFSEIQINIGPDQHPFDLSQWADKGREYMVPLPEPSEKDVARPVPITFTASVSDWVGKDVAIAVKTAVKSNKNYSSWSNVEHVRVVSPLKPPVIAVDATANGYRLTWNEEGPNTQYRILRQGPGETAPVQIGTSSTAEYIDGGAKWDTPYKYSVIAVNGIAKSLASDVKTIQKPDIYSPAVPSGLTGLASGDTAELSWHRNSEPDLKGYYVYRSDNNGPFVRQGDLVALPTFGDRKVEHGHTYRYEVSSVDQRNNESDKSPPTEVTIP